MKSSDKHMDLVGRYLDGQATPEEAAHLEEHMLKDPQLRADYLACARVDAAMPRAVGGNKPLTTIESPFPAKLWRWHRAWTAAAAVLLLGAGLTLSLWDSRPGRATISASHGPVQWTNREGQTLDQLQPGTSFEGGLLESLLPESWIELAFHDGSKVTLSGHSTLMMSPGERKHLHLRHGSLSAQVAPQPESVALMVSTPVAELRVLGTQFHVDAQQDATNLIVNEGRVELKRLVDGSSTEVAGGYQAVATVDGTHKLQVNPRGKAKRVWRSDLAKEATYGKWSTNTEKLAIQLKKMVASGEISQAEGIAKFEEMVKLGKAKGKLKADAKSSGHGKSVQAIVVLTLSKGTDSPVIVPENAKFRIRGNLETSATVEFGFTTHQPRGLFSGKFSVERTLPVSGEDGFELEIALDAFQSNHQGTEGAVAGMEIRDWWCATADHAAQLEITHVELLTPSP